MKRFLLLSAAALAAAGCVPPPGPRSLAQGNDTSYIDGIRRRQQGWAAEDAVAARRRQAEYDRQTEQMRRMPQGGSELSPAQRDIYNSQALRDSMRALSR